MKTETRIVRAGRAGAAHNIVNPPVYRASTVLFESYAQIFEIRQSQERRLYYGRSGTPTTWCLADAIAELEGGAGCALFPSGLAAIATAILAFVSPGDTILVSDSVYGATRLFCDNHLPNIQVKTVYYPPAAETIERYFDPSTRLIFVESPGSQTFEMQDLPAIAKAARARGIKVLADNTWASPVLFRPLAFGADVSIQAATKYIVGHSDALAGSVAASQEAWPAIEETARHFGQCIGPDEAYLAQRGIRTLAVRLARHQESAMLVARWLEKHPLVERVLYPPLENSPGHAIWARDFAGASGLFAIILDENYSARVPLFYDSLKLFGIGASWGGYESLVYPADPVRTAEPWSARGHVTRLHIGLEDPHDLISDLDNALQLMRA